MKWGSATMRRAGLRPVCQPGSSSHRRPLGRRWTTTPFGTMHARVGRPEEGRSASTVVLVPGMVVASDYMVPTGEYLAPWCTVYAIDLPGYGRSEKPRAILSLPQLADAVTAWMDREDIARAHLVANSFGCQITAELARRHPERIDRLVWQGPTVDPSARSLIRQVWRLMKNSRLESPGLGAITRQDYWAAGLRRVIGTLRIALQDRLEDKLAEVTAPVLVVRGENDPLVPEQWAEEITRRLPHGQLVLMAGLAHTINYTAPERFVATMRPFLQL